MKFKLLDMVEACPALDPGVQSPTVEGVHQAHPFQHEQTVQLALCKSHEFLTMLSLQGPTQIELTMVKLVTPVLAAALVGSALAFPLASTASHKKRENNGSVDAAFENEALAWEMSGSHLIVASHSLCCGALQSRSLVTGEPFF